MELIAFCRVSTARQGESGLGLEAQRSKLQQLAADRWAVVVAEFVEVESGRKAERPKLVAAMAEDRKRGAVVGVAKLDRLARMLSWFCAWPAKLTATASGGCCSPICLM